MRMSRHRFILGLSGAACVVLTAGCHRQTADDHLRKAKDYLAHSQLQEGVVELRLAEQADPNRGDVRENLADAYMRVPDLSGAYREYVRAADLLPNDIHAQLAAGQILLRAGQFEDAKARANKAIALDAKNVDADILLGNAMAGLKDLDGAIAEYQDAITLDPAKDTAYANIGTIQLVRGQKDQAEASFRKAVAVAPKSLPARLALANFFWASRRAPDAEQTLKDALALDPANLTANSALGSFYMTTNRAKEAEPYYQAIARAANTTRATLGLADYYSITKRIPDARRVLDDLAAKKNDGYAAAITRLAALGRGRRATRAGREPAERVAGQEAERDVGSAAPGPPLRRGRQGRRRVERGEVDRHGRADVDSRGAGLCSHRPDSRRPAISQKMPSRPSRRRSSASRNR